MTDSIANGQPQSDENNPNEFERVEAIICPNCPVHGRRSSSNGGRNNEISIPVSRSPPKSSPAQRPASSGSLAQHLAPEQIEPRRASSGDASQIKVVEPLNVAKTDTPPSQNEAAEVSDCGSFTETLQTISTPGRSPATPCFNPSTPKAMVLNTNDLDVEPLFSGHLDGSEKTPTTQCADMGTIAPTSSVA
ncbi:hypothetical protein NM208_g15758 [Fusarium decemcellulare]|uniref:Uncharacterized protein n=1 Tax=Fusarium decemcellulare TaxID=57161 RepID=A0ACC1RE03_9HYPO|nr:hypothetical protein NM208_g15758 [Fusarium decemcellulare]